MQIQGQSVRPSRHRLPRPGTVRPQRSDGALFHTGPRVATSALSLPLQYLMATIAATPTFQAWTRTPNATAALGSVYTPNAPPNSPLPYAIVDVLRAFTREMIAGGSRNYFEGHGGISLWIRSAIPGGANDQDAATYMENQVGNLVTDMEQLAGQAGYLDVERIELVDGPYRPEEDERVVLGDFYEILLRVEYRSL